MVGERQLYFECFVKLFYIKQNNEASSLRKQKGYARKASQGKKMVLVLWKSSFFEKVIVLLAFLLKDYMYSFITNIE